MRNKNQTKNKLQKFYQTDEFKVLNSQWKQTLEETGFKDLEKSRQEYDMLPSKDTDARYAHKFITMEQTIAYFDSAKSYLLSGEFSTSIEKQVWEVHCEGMTYSEIGRALNLTRRQVQTYVELTRSKVKNSNE